VVSSEKPAAYELLAKLCVAGLASLSDPSASAQRRASQIAYVLVAAIGCRNELSLPTAGWGKEGPSANPALIAASPALLRSEMATQLQRLNIDGPTLDEVKAMLPLM